MRERDKLQLNLLRYGCTPNGCASNFSFVLDTRNVRELGHWDVNSESVRVVFFLHKQFGSLDNW